MWKPLSLLFVIGVVKKKESGLIPFLVGKEKDTSQPRHRIRTKRFPPPSVYYAHRIWQKGTWATSSNWIGVTRSVAFVTGAAQKPSLPAGRVLESEHTSYEVVF